MSICCQDLSIIHRGKTVMPSFNLNLPAGEISAFYGPTGSGKTALLLVIAGLLKPASGSITIGNINISKETDRLRFAVGMSIIQDFNPLIANLTLEENLLLQARALKLTSPKQRVNEVLQYFGLQRECKQLAGTLPALKNTEAGLALAILADPTVILVDEPEYRLTTEETDQIWLRLKAQQALGKTIIISTRHLETANRCENVVIISAGKVVRNDEFSKSGYSGSKAALA